MASISTDPKGNRTIQFTAKDKRRRSVYLGKLPKRDAEGIRSRVEQLNIACISGHTVSADCAKWLASLADDGNNWLLSKLAAVGLIPERETTSLRAFIDGYITGRTDLGPTTTRHLRMVEKNLVKFFGTGRSLCNITPGECDDFRLFLMKTLAENTVRRHCGRAKQFFQAALRKKLISSNPFADMKGCGVKANKSRDYFVTREESAKVIESCPNRQWRLLFSLARFGGLRMPSEILELRWSDFDWERSRMTVTSPKTKRYEGHESRIVPIFPELRDIVDESFHAAADKAEFVFPDEVRNGNVNLRTQLERIIKRAGLKPWPKLFQNLRATRATEVAAEFPAHVAAEWLGHSTLVAQKHYWRTTDADFEKATQTAQRKVTRAPQQELAKSSATHAEKGLQMATQHSAAIDGNALESASKPAENHVLLQNRREKTGEPVPRLGLEPRTL